MQNTNQQLTVSATTNSAENQYYLELVNVLLAPTLILSTQNFLFSMLSPQQPQSAPHSGCIEWLHRRLLEVARAI